MNRTEFIGTNLYYSQEFVDDVKNNYKQELDKADNKNLELIELINKIYDVIENKDITGIEARLKIQELLNNQISGEEKKIPDEININLAYIDKEYLLDKEDVDRKINEIINRHNILVDKVIELKEKVVDLESQV